jgi:glycosyltransferase involved in cell wall biosynthesis
MNPRITVITVTYNPGPVLEWTLKSVQDQSYKNIEYIIIDGGSSDGTLDLVDKYNSIITRWISEPDEGLYSAMNKGLKLAVGDYVMFLNAGDIFFDRDVLKNVFSLESSDIYYGETMIMGSDGKDIGMRRLKAPEVLTWKSLIDGMLVCHQSFIVRRTVCREYDTRYRIAADYDWMLDCLRKADKVTNTKLIISRFLDGGINKHNIRKALKERFLIMIRYYNFFLVVLNHFRIGFRFAVSYLKNGRF